MMLYDVRNLLSQCYGMVFCVNSSTMYSSLLEKEKLPEIQVPLPVSPLNIQLHDKCGCWMRVNHRSSDYA